MRQVLPIVREQIEGEVSGGVAPLHHVSKDRPAHVFGDHEFAIQDGRLRIHLFHECRSEVLIAGELVFLP